MIYDDASLLPVSPHHFLAEGEGVRLFYATTPRLSFLFFPTASLTGQTLILTETARLGVVPVCTGWMSRPPYGRRVENTQIFIGHFENAWAENQLDGTTAAVAPDGQAVTGAARKPVRTSLSDGFTLGWSHYGHGCTEAYNGVFYLARNICGLQMSLIFIHPGKVTIDPTKETSGAESP